MDFFDTFPFTKLQGKNRGLDWVMQKLKEFQKAVDDIPETVSKAVSEITPSIATDKTLTLADAPADSKTVGDRLSSLGAVDVHARPDTWTPNASEVGARPETWLPTIEEIGAAPDDFGLGAYAGMTVTDANEATKNGWYLVQSGAANAADTNEHPMLVVAYDSGGVNQIGFFGNTTSGATYVKTRKKSNGGWQEWEWLNPPMFVGVEYKTMEKYEGGAHVYAQLVDLGTTTETFSATVTIDGITRLIRAVPILNDSVCTDWDASAGFNSINAFYFYPEKSANSVAFRAQCASARTGKNLKAQIWYTK